MREFSQKNDLNRTDDYSNRLQSGERGKSLLRSLKARRSVQNILESKEKLSNTNSQVRDIESHQVNINLSTVGRNNVFGNIKKSV